MSGAAAKGLSSSIHLAVLGVGLVGSEFISQVLKFSAFKLVYISSSKKSVSASSVDGVLGSDWRQKLDASNSSSAGGPEQVMQHFKLSLNPARAVVIDNTSSQTIASWYPSFLKAGISVVTPNKKAFSGSAALWNDIQAAAQEGGARVMYEATVGAGLPIIAPMKELVGTGDEITKIEGVFSGTLSYIFNEYSSPNSGNANSQAPSFSSVVKIARDNGYTEPNPADDLSGSDVARKLTILSRIIPGIGAATQYSNGWESVDTTSLVPTDLQSFQGDGSAFIEELKKYDSEFEARRKEAALEEKVLRYVGSINPTGGSYQIKASLEKYPVTHPFAASLRGSDNIVLIYTKRYGERPLMVQGAGAGAAVTAMGVFGDVLKLAAAV